MKNTQFLSGKEASEALDRDGGKYTLELTHNLVGGFADDYRKLMGNVPEADIDWQPCVDRYLESVEKIKKDGHMFVVVQNEKPVGMQGYKHLGKDPATGREVYELSHGSILEEAEGQGYLKELISLAMQAIRENGDVDILFGSSNKEFRERLASKLHFDPISLEHFYQIKYSKSDVSEHREEIEKKKVHSQYYLLPATKKIS